MVYKFYWAAESNMTSSTKKGFLPLLYNIAIFAILNLGQPYYFI